MENVATEEFIRRDVAMKAVASQYGACRSPAQNRMIDEIRNKIRRMPAADVAEVVHGQWYMLEDCANAGLYCSACGRRVHHEEFAYKKLKSKYCPHCGARMDGGVDHA